MKKKKKKGALWRFSSVHYTQSRRSLLICEGHNILPTKFLSDALEYLFLLLLLRFRQEYNVHRYIFFLYIVRSYTHKFLFFFVRAIIIVDVCSCSSIRIYAIKEIHETLSSLFYPYSNYRASPPRLSIFFIFFFVSNSFSLIKFLKQFVLNQ